MHKLIVSLPANREFEGRLTLEEENGRVLAGPFPVCGLADRAAAGRHGNPSGQPLLPYGDTPLGRYRIAGIHATGRKTSLSAELFGPHGVIVLTPTAGDAALADANGRFCIAIQGGTLGPGRRLRPTNGSLRLTDKDQRALVRALRKSRRPCVCECVAATQPVTARTVARTAPYESFDPPLSVNSLSVNSLSVAALSLPIAAANAVFFGGDRSSHLDGHARRFAGPSFRLADGGGGGGAGAGGGGAAGDGYGDQGFGPWNGTFPNLGGAADDMQKNFVNCAITGFPGKLTSDANDALLSAFDTQLKTEGQPAIDADSANVLKNALNSTVWSNFFNSAGQCVATQSQSAFGSLDSASAQASVPPNVPPPQGSTVFTLGDGIYTFNSKGEPGVNYTTADFLNFAKTGSLDTLVAPFETNLNHLTVGVDNKGLNYDLGIKAGITISNPAGKVEFSNPSVGLTFTLKF
jgi:hypothetical protein